MPVLLQNIQFIFSHSYFTGDMWEKSIPVVKQCSYHLFFFFSSVASQKSLTAQPRVLMFKNMGLPPEVMKLEC